MSWEGLLIKVPVNRLSNLQFVWRDGPGPQVPLNPTSSALAYYGRSDPYYFTLVIRNMYTVLRKVQECRDGMRTWSKKGVATEQREQSMAHKRAHQRRQGQSNNYMIFSVFESRHFIKMLTSNLVKFEFDAFYC